MFNFRKRGAQKDHCIHAEQCVAKLTASSVEIAESQLASTGSVETLQIAASTSAVCEARLTESTKINCKQVKINFNVEPVLPRDK